jgi:hypothetical protein
MINKEETKAKMVEIFSGKISSWIDSQEGQTDGFEYERSYVEAMQRISSEVFQLSMGKNPKSKNQKKKLQTTQGVIKVSKKHCLHNNSSFCMSQYLQYQCCYLGQQVVFQQAEDIFMKMQGLSVTAKQVERICHHYGNELESDFSTGKIAENKEVTPAKPTTYVMMDGGMILTRDKEHPWKELKLGRIFNSQEHVKGISKNRNLITNSLYVGHLGGHKEFLNKLDYFIEDIPNSSKVFIADGAPWIWKWVDDMYPDSTQILDYFHAVEHLSEFASLYFKEQQEKTKWRKQQEKLLSDDKMEEVMETLISLSKTIKQATKKDVLKKLINYYQTNKKRMKYKTFKEQGYLIGSGAMESAIRNVVQQRLKRSGQRWTITGGQQVLNLRTLFLSNLENMVIDKIKLTA